MSVSFDVFAHVTVKVNSYFRPKNYTIVSRRFAIFDKSSKNTRTQTEMNDFHDEVHLLSLRNFEYLPHFSFEEKRNK